MEGNTPVLPLDKGEIEGVIQLVGGSPPCCSLSGVEGAVKYIDRINMIDRMLISQTGGSKEITKPLPP